MLKGCDVLFRTLGDNVKDQENSLKHLKSEMSVPIVVVFLLILETMCGAIIGQWAGGGVCCGYHQPPASYRKGGEGGVRGRN